MYAAQLLKQKNETELYRCYVTESLRLHAQGKYLKDSYADYLHPTKDFDPDEVVSQVAANGGLEVINR